MNRPTGLEQMKAQLIEHVTKSYDSLEEMMQSHAEKDQQRVADLHAEVVKVITLLLCLVLSLS
jgi:hypothetical protein